MNPTPLEKESQTHSLHPHEEGQAAFYVFDFPYLDYSTLSRYQANLFTVISLFGNPLPVQEACVSICTHSFTLT